MRLEANPNYWNATGGYPKTKTIVIKFYADSAGLALAIDAGEIDIAFRQLAATDINNLKTKTHLKVWEGTGAFIQYLVLARQNEHHSTTQGLDRLLLQPSIEQQLSTQFFLGKSKIV
jgi:ABC-type transport system substrate-binding protein